MDVRGRNLVTGLPKTMTVTSDEMMDALKEPAMHIVEAVHNVLERTPPELAADVYRARYCDDRRRQPASAVWTS